MGKDELEVITALSERGRVVVGIWEDERDCTKRPLSQNRRRISRSYATAYPCSNSILALWILDHDRRYAICEIFDRRLPVLLRNRCSEVSCWNLRIFVWSAGITHYISPILRLQYAQNARGIRTGPCKPHYNRIRLTICKKPPI